MVLKVFRFYTLLILGFLVHTACSKNEEGPSAEESVQDFHRLDSIIDRELPGNEITFKRLFIYNENNRLESKVHQDDFWFNENEPLWQKRCDYSYSESGHLSSETESTHNSDGWELFARFEYDYDVNNLLSTITQLQWQSEIDKWELIRATDISYELTGNLISTKFEYITGGAFPLDIHTHYQYVSDNDTLLIEEFHILFNDTLRRKVSVFDYNQDQKLILKSETTEARSDSNDDWSEIDSIVYTFNQDEILIEKEFNSNSDLAYIETYTYVQSNRIDQLTRTYDSGHQILKQYFWSGI